MKKFITFLLVMGCIAMSHAQKVIQLEEAEVNYSPTAKIIFEDYANGKFIVKENYSQQFQADAVKFLLDNFDIKGFMEANKDQNFDEYYVTVKSKNGFLKATYDKAGELENTFQKFRNINLPSEVREKVYTSHKGWTITANSYMAKGESTSLNQERYTVTVENGKNKEKLRLYPNKTSISSVADIEK